MRKVWTEQEKSELRQLYADIRTATLGNRFHCSTEQVYGMAHRLGLKKSEAYMASADACRLRREGEIGKKNRFPKGNIPWNKGTKGIHTGGEATQFKPGQMPHNTRQVGTVVMSADGYLKMKVAEPRTWRYVHRMNWEAVHGPIPKAMCLIFRDGNHENCGVENLMLLTRPQMMLRNTIHNHPQEIKSVMHIRAGIVRRINDKRRKTHEQ